MFTNRWLEIKRIEFAVIGHADLTDALREALACSLDLGCQVWFEHNGQTYEIHGPQFIESLIQNFLGENS